MNNEQFNIGDCEKELLEPCWAENLGCVLSEAEGFSNSLLAAYAALAGCFG